MQDYEKLGALYLGKRYDLDSDKLTEDLVLYDNKDLTTHAVIIGMTGSGKTGLGVGLIEEAALDHVPVIAIDPKGDMGNLLLTFPKLKPKDFEPWVDPKGATRAGLDVPGFAKDQAALWKKGLKQWGQSPERIARLREAADFRIYTPGSSAGQPISALGEFKAPEPGLSEQDPDLFREYIQATATGLLTLLDIDGDPLTSREHILVARILDEAFRAGRSMDLAALISAIQQPAFDRIGVMDLESFYPANDRFSLSMRINNLLAAPGFEAWLKGDPLNVAKLLHSPEGKPRVSVLSIAHLSDSERMFFVTLLLNEVIRWMRAQPGTGSLRAILYMDELFGYMPPISNPPSKQLFLTLLKQARAYGLGLVLSTQNPVDLDYKGLSNTGTWFIGRLQTERDKARVMEGLEGAGAGAEFDRGEMEETLAGLGKRRFLLHNVHESEPVVFNTRWVMSYLAGPMTRDQIKRLSPRDQDDGGGARAPATRVVERPGADISSHTPVLPPGLDSRYLPVTEDGDGDLVYDGRLLLSAAVTYQSVRHKVDERREWLLLGDWPESGRVPDYQDFEETGLALDDTDTDPEADAGFLPASTATKAELKKWLSRAKRFVRTERPLMLLRSDAHKVTSQPDESEGEFRARLQQIGNEKRDLKVEALKKRYQGKTKTLNDRLLRARQAVERESQQASKRKMDTAISVGSAILGAVLGRRIGARAAGRLGTAAKGYGAIRKEAGDIVRAKERVSSLEADLVALSEEFEQQVAALDAAYDAQLEELKEVRVRAKSTDIDIGFLGVGFTPLWRGENRTTLEAAFKPQVEE